MFIISKFKIFTELDQNLANINSIVAVVVTDICCGGRHSLVLTRDGDVYAFGSNSFGQCSDDRRVDQSLPIKVKIPKVCAISCGNRHSIALTKSGAVYGWGDNSNEQLGIGTANRYWFWNKLQEFGVKDDAKQFTPIELNVPKIAQIMCGSYHTLMLSSDGDIYFCGRIGDCIASDFPTKINYTSATKFVEIASTIHCDLCVALSVDNVCYIFGRTGNTEKRITAKCLQQTMFTSIAETYAFYEQITYKSIIVDSYNNEMCQTLPSHSLNTPITSIATQLQSLITDLDVNTSATNEHNDYDCHTVSLTRDESGFGLRLDGGSGNGSYVVIGLIIRDGVAHRNGVLRVGDQIISINDCDVTGLTLDDVVKRLSHSDTGLVCIKIRRKTHYTFV